MTSLPRRIVRNGRRRARHSKRLLKSALRPYEPLTGGAEVLNAEYGRGDWDYLIGEREVPRFNVVCGCCQRTTRRPRVLEIGCGEGMLADQLTPERFEQFVGVDIAAPAVERALARSLPNSCFIAADAAEFAPSMSFDVIVFNEVLEYFTNPAQLVRRYEKWLLPGGEFVVSQYRADDDARTRKIWRGLHRRYTTRLRTRVTTANLTWTIEAFAPPV
jgi:2-polyprenyl-3-methyl-5-hydroxy-6-metoxy-1,4-benzoquinol methylase